MKNKLLLTLLLTAAAPALLNAQGGSLTPPPGVPGPTMKSLDIVEARIPLVAGSPGVSVNGTTGAITITAPGSYYLTSNLTTTGTASCINVGNHTCTIDLNGFTVSRTTGTESGSAGILVSGAAGQKVMIRNGFIVGGGREAGFAAAIDTTDAYSGSVHVENVHCSNVRNGIILNHDEARNTVQNCSVENSGGEGIRAEIVTTCIVRDTISHGIFGNLISNCQVTQSSSTFAGIGITTAFSGTGLGTVSHCHVRHFTGVANWTGIRAAAVNYCYVPTPAVSGTVSISASLAVGCHTTGASPSITNKYNMP